nr:alpha/beta hydrolase [Rhodococcus sp. (in: high G+C Gram-positive bacteria)]
MAEHSIPVVFVHGLWLHAASWDPWLEHFSANGYAASAPGWPGDGETVDATRSNPTSVAGYGIEDVVKHYTEAISSLDTKPIVIGHSFGGLIAQKLLARGIAAAAVAIDPAPIKGVLALPFSTLKAGFPVLGNPANRNKAIALTADQFRYAFGNAIPEARSQALYDRWSIPSPGRPLFQAAASNFTPHSEAAVDTRRSDRGPLLVTAGGLDHTVPESVSRGAFKLYRKSNAVTDFHNFATRGHSLTIDDGWPEVADSVLEWLTKQAL